MGHLRTDRRKTDVNSYLKQESKMNYHYIDYMIRERRREELEECERRRLLKSSGTSQTGWIPWARRIFSNAVERLKEIRPGYDCLFHTVLLVNVKCCKENYDLLLLIKLGKHESQNT